MTTQRPILSDLSSKLQKAIKDALWATGCMDLYEGDVLLILDVIRDRLEFQKNRLKKASSLATEMNNLLNGRIINNG